MVFALVGTTKKMPVDSYACSEYSNGFPKAEHAIINALRSLFLCISKTFPRPADVVSLSALLSHLFLLLIAYKPLLLKSFQRSLHFRRLSEGL